ncbi:pitrilysin family protein [Nocardioides sp. GY 10127]|uniref:M16 family metallopeptidase n=1 Tax=Nocardioides sp. GY 10127 TaxID=2569762 RepID=UPI001F0D46DD|nr:pitrilysin family protein [Nocardioides sp. GY 10127]
MTSTTRPATDPTGPTEGLTGLVRRTVLPDGLRVVTEQMAGVRSASIGVWVNVGSADEDDVLHGCSHFLEHLLFKGTARRSALDISVALDEVGGEFNAFTAKEMTCFHARVLDVDLPLAVDVLGDMLTASLLEPADVDAERDVILDEIAMHDDDPDDVVHDLFAELAWGARTPLGRGIAGTVESIEALTRDQVERFYRTHYRPATTVVAVAGNVDHDAVVELVAAAFEGYGPGGAVEEPVSRLATGARVPVHAGRAHVERPFEQVNLVLGMEGLRRDHPDRFALGALTTALGGGTSSRLFQEVRERRGLAYSVYSFSSHHADSGLVGVGLGCLPERLDGALDVVRAELVKVAEGGLTEEELRRGRGQLRGGLVLGLEDSGSRMSRLGKAELVHERYLPVEEVLSRIESVDVHDVARVAAEVLRGEEILAVVGPGRA